MLIIPEGKYFLLQRHVLKPTRIPCLDSRGRCNDDGYFGVIVPVCLKTLVMTSAGVRQLSILRGSWL